MHVCARVRERVCVCVYVFIHKSGITCCWVGDKEIIKAGMQITAGGVIGYGVMATMSVRCCYY